MAEPRDGADSEDQEHAAPYRAEDFTKLQYVPPTLFQRTWGKLKIIGALIGVTMVLAFCARVAGWF